MGSIGRNSVAVATNLAKLLPTGTVLAVEALVPSFSNNGSCLTSNKCLTISAIFICSAICLLSSFTDRFQGHDNKLYYGISTPTATGFCVFNSDGQKVKRRDKKKGSQKDQNRNEEQASHDIENGEGKQKTGKDDGDPYYTEDLEKLRIEPKDYVHVILSLAVFLVFGISNSDVQGCFFPHQGANENQLMVNLPIGISVLASALFMIFPTKRRGLCSAEKTAPKNCPKCNWQKEDKSDKNGAGLHNVRSKGSAM